MLDSARTAAPIDTLDGGSHSAEQATISSSLSPGCRLFSGLRGDVELLDLAIVTAAQASVIADNRVLRPGCRVLRLR